MSAARHRTFTTPPRASPTAVPAAACPSADAHRIGFSHSAKAIVPIQEYVATRLLPTPAAGPATGPTAAPAPPRTLVFVLGAFAHGHVDDSYVDEYLSISQYPLSAAYALGRITNALEHTWGIV